MSTSPGPRHIAGKHRYTSVVDGIALANDFARSRQTMSEFARQRGVSFSMVRYWSIRARRLASASEPGLVQVAEVSLAGAIKPVAPPQEPTPLPAPRPPSLPSMAVMKPAPSSPTIEVRLPGGVSIAVGAGFSPAVLSQVIACLGGRPC
jgi:hypothetical protein